MTLRQISFRRVLTRGLIFLIIILLSGCDSERNRLIMGLFQTETPIPPTPTATQASTPSPTPESVPTPSAIISFGISDHDYLRGESPPGRITREISAITGSKSGICSKTELLMTVSKDASGNGISAPAVKIVFS